MFKEKSLPTQKIERLILLGKPYCWRVAPQQSSLPLQVYNIKIIQFSNTSHQLFLSSLPKKAWF